MTAMNWKPDTINSIAAVVVIVAIVVVCRDEVAIMIHEIVAIVIVAFVAVCSL